MRVFISFQEVVHIRALEQRILTEGRVLPGEVLKVGSFLNQQIDTKLLKEMGDEVAGLFSQSNVTKVLTIESSGIALAYAAAVSLGVPMVFAKKYGATNVTGEFYKTSVYSYTHQKTFDIVVSKEFIKPDDVVLVCDDFLAKGNALNGLIHIVELAGASLAGALIAIEKGQQGGGDLLREEGIRVESLALIDSMEDGKIVFRS